MLQSMTGFASGQGQEGAFGWSWELRSVNGKGLDLRLRVPDWIDGLEVALRARLGKALARGNVQLSLRLSAETGEAVQVLNHDQLGAVLTALAEVETQAMERGVTLAPANAAQILGLRGVLDQPRHDTDPAGLRQTLMADFEAVLDSFAQMRAGEGAALGALLSEHLDQIAALTEEAARLAEARADEMRAGFRTALARVMENADGADEARVSQELAVLAVKADVTEEIDRLSAHVAAARDLLAQGSPVGRKLDFLSQEFNREANTLCSKAQNTALTAVGLELKTVIDQLREQVQNVE